MCLQLGRKFPATEGKSLHLLVCVVWCVGTVEYLVNKLVGSIVICSFLNRQFKVKASLVVPATIYAIIYQSNEASCNNGASRLS